jgi:hypothetical protein
LVSEKIDNHKADVVASARVFGTRIAQACDETNRHGGSASPKTMLKEMRLRRH